MTDPTAAPSAPAVAVRDKLIRLQDAQTSLEPTGAVDAAAKHVDHAIERLADTRLVS